MYQLEDIANKIRTVLQSDLPGELDTIDTDKNDGITLEDPRVYFIGGGHTFSPHQLPALFINGDDAPEELTGKKYRHVFTMNVWLEIREANKEKAQKLVWRYSDAIHEVFAKSINYDLGDNVISVKTTRKTTGFVEGDMNRMAAHVILEVAAQSPAKT